MIRTSLAHRKSLSQKENRHRVYERNRQFGLKEVNVTLEGRDLGNIHETSQDVAPEKASSKTSKEGSFVNVSTFESKGVWRDGSAVFLQRIWGQFLVWWFTTICNSGFRGSNFAGACMGVAHVHTP